MIVFLDVEMLSLLAKNNVKTITMFHYDGCYQYNYQRDENCTNRQKGFCFDFEIGFHLTQHKCESKCGDGIKNGNEQCDDENDIPRDGCTQCKIDPNYKCSEDNNNLSFCYKCQDHCTEFIYIDSTISECQKCDSGYFLKDNSCNQQKEKCEECENTRNNSKQSTTKVVWICNNISGLNLDQQLNHVSLNVEIILLQEVNNVMMVIIQIPQNAILKKICLQIGCLL